LRQISPSRKQKQIDRTKSWIIEALIQYAHAGKYDDVSISQLCQKAGVTRPTFYRYFKNKDDVIRLRIHEQYQALLSTLSNTPANEVDLKLVNLETLKNWKAYETLTQLAKYPEISPIFNEVQDKLFEDMIQRFKVYSDMDPFLRRFRIGGMKEVLIEWARQDLRETPEMVHARLGNIVGL